MLFVMFVVHVNFLFGHPQLFGSPKIKTLEDPCSMIIHHHIPSGKKTWQWDITNESLNGKKPYGNGRFSIAMFDYQRAFSRYQTISRMVTDL